MSSVEKTEISSSSSSEQENSNSDSEDISTAETLSVSERESGNVGDVFIDQEIWSWPTSEIVIKTRLIQDQSHVAMRHIALVVENMRRLGNRIDQMSFQLAVRKKLPLLVGHLVEMLNIKLGPEDVPITDVERKEGYRKCPVIKTGLGSRATYFLPILGFVCPDALKPGDLLAMDKDKHTIFEVLPHEYDSRITAMEVTQRPSDRFSDIGGLKEQIEELQGALILPITRKEMIKKIGIQSPKGVLLYGPPGTGKTMLARATAAETQTTFLRISGTSLVQMFIGEGAKMVRDAFEFAKSKTPSILFIDEIDSIGKKRCASDVNHSGNREVQRTLMELLNQLDGFESSDDVKVIAATNRVDVLDPALIRSGRIDRKIELPLPSLRERSEILKVHSRKMTTKAVNFDELAGCTVDFNGAQCRAVCVEAGMIALRRGSAEVTHNDFMDGIMEVQQKKKTKYFYFG